MIISQRKREDTCSCNFIGSLPGWVREYPTKQEKEQVRELARVLEAKEKHNEEILGRASLTREEAKRLYHESSGLIRAIMSLRDLEAGRIRLKEPAETRPGVEDAKRWLGFLRSISKRNI